MREAERYLCILIALVLLIFGTAKEGARQKEVMMYDCIHNCAMCVEHWELGLYNGPRCARNCLKHKGQKIVDPDCSKLKMFNYDPQVLKEHRKQTRHRIREEADGKLED